jgi:hypothetical protein
MIVRIWRTRVDVGRVREYERFAIDRSLPMFRQQPGFLGVLFARTGGDCLVLTVWHGPGAIEALEASPSYLETVARITDAGFLVGDPSVEILEVHGGDLSAIAHTLTGDSAA